MSASERYGINLPSADTFGFDPDALAVRNDPYATYRMMRDSGPVLWSERLGARLVVTHAAARAALHDTRLVAHPRTAGPSEAATPGRVLMFMEPPEHTRLRRLLSQAFTPRTVERLRPKVVAIVDSLLDATCAQHAMDVVADLALPLPVAVIAELLGVPNDDREFFRSRSLPLANAFDWDPQPTSLSLATDAAFALIPYFLRLVRRRRVDPGDDLITALIEAESEGDRISRGELVTTCVLLFVAGYMTTANLIGNGMLALLSHREQFDAIVEDTGRIPQAVQECLRYDSPVQITPRSARVDVLVADALIRAGETLLVVLGSANRDDEVFRNGDTFDISRAGGGHVTFGRGIHYCLGAALATLEAEVVFERIAERLPHITILPVQLGWKPSKTQRGLECLPVKF